MTVFDSIPQTKKFDDGSHSEPQLLRSGTTSEINYRIRSQEMRVQQKIIRRRPDLVQFTRLYHLTRQLQTDSIYFLHFSIKVAVRQSKEIYRLPFGIPSINLCP